ncbi:MAG: hypothetical protein FD156_1133 [Nitrospirae bacterium]|nr:MAG: hypothetical protein FD156_1133 [Nitrospirota bacterium]
MAERKLMSEGVAKITIEISPTEKDSKIKPFKKVLEFHINREDLPIKVSAESAKVITKAFTLAEEMCED